MTGLGDRVRALRAGTRSAWASVDERARWAGGSVVAFVVLLLLSNTSFAVGVAVLAAVVWAARLRMPAANSRLTPVVWMLAAVSLIALGLIEGRGVHDATVPGTAASFDPGAGATAGSAAVAQRLEPADPVAWELGGAIEDTKTPTSRGVTDLERAVILDVGDRRALLLLANLYLQYGGPLVNSEIAAYYTALAGYAAPPGPHTQR